MKQTPLFNCARVTTAIMSLCAGSALACQQGGGATSIFELPGLGGSGGQVNAINSTGQLTGSSFVTNDLASHAFFFGENVLIDIGTFGGNLSEGLAINNVGMIVGDADVDAFSFHAFSYDRTNLVDLGTLGGSYTIADAVNDEGQIAGNSSTAGGSRHEVILLHKGLINFHG